MKIDVTFAKTGQSFGLGFGAGPDRFPVGFAQLQTVAGAPDVDIYTGEHLVVPHVDAAQELPTAQKYVTRDIKVEKIPMYETANDAGGNTISIGEMYYG